APRSVLLTLSPDTFSPGASSLSLRCTVGSSNPPVTSYRWHQTRYGSSQTTGTRTSTRKINQLTKDTDYWCEAINSVGPTTSEKTKLPVYGGYGWAVWTPVSVRAHVGSCVIIPCRFRVPRTASAPWIGIWLKDHNFSGTRVYSTSGESGADYKRRVHFLGSMEDQNCSLKIQNLGLSDSGKYFFRLEGPDKWSDPIGVNLLVSGEPEAPEISDPGQVVEGTSVSLTCSLHSYCADDVPLLLWQPPPHLPAVPRIIYRDQHWIHSSEVEFMPSSDERQRAVSCEATFAIGTSSVRTVRALNVKYPPRNVTVSLRVNGWINRSLSEGDRVLLSCSSTSADPPVQSYTWYRNGVEIYGKNSHDLEFPSISYVDFGKYACQASNAVGSSRTEEVTVTGKHKPQGVHIESRVNGVEVGGTVNVKMNDRLSLACVSRVSDPPVNSYSWKRNGFVSGQRDQTLVFDRITPQQDGRYLCTSGNGIGTVSSETITVNVQYAPINVRTTAPTAPPAGEYITLRCEAQANPAVNSYSWRKLCGSQSTDLWGYGVEYRLRATVGVGTCDYFCTPRNYLGLKQSSAQHINVQCK
ncbi:B-cell receptor CD22-like, partial [Leucoraja erinacea]|uniref:B-cell receptor CD22-like n=1 Tax=Leucoraja erinaceus TaxID=7782 RepID=UPI002455DA05